MIDIWVCFVDAASFCCADGIGFIRDLLFGSEWKRKVGIHMHSNDSESDDGEDDDDDGDDGR